MHVREEQMEIKESGIWSGLEERGQLHVESASTWRSRERAAARC